MYTFYVRNISLGTRTSLHTKYTIRKRHIKYVVIKKIMYPKRSGEHEWLKEVSEKMKESSVTVLRYTSMRYRRMYLSGC